MTLCFMIVLLSDTNSGPSHCYKLKTTCFACLFFEKDFLLLKFKITIPETIHKKKYQKVVKSNFIYSISRYYCWCYYFEGLIPRYLQCLLFSQWLLHLASCHFYLVIENWKPFPSVYTQLRTWLHMYVRVAFLYILHICNFFVSWPFPCLYVTLW